jgi:hypothetical protein
MKRLYCVENKINSEKYVGFTSKNRIEPKNEDQEKGESRVIRENHS